ncbi:MAG TPA: hypothetical protein VL528_07960 [Oxalicibacterium sp.]|nr:hypothetical protein [Oxalicibacterium sp.]
MKKILAFSAALIAGTSMMLAAAPAMARVDVDVNLGVPAPVYVAPRPVYMQPRPVYVAPQPVYYVKHRHHRRWHDRDRDGVPDRYDHHPRNPYRD